MDFIDLRRFKTIVRWWWLAVLSVTISVAVSYYFSMQEPRIYKTTATLMVGQAVQKINPGSQDFYMAEQLGMAYAQMVTREPILQDTIDSLELEMDWRALGWQVSAWQVPQTQLLQVSVTDTSPERAALIADEISYQLVLQTPTSPQNVARQQRGQFVQDQLDDLEGRIQSAQDKMIELESELNVALSANQIKNLQGEINNLQNLINGWQTTYTNLLGFLDGGGSPNTLSIIEPAIIPTNPISPNVKMNLVLAALTGFMLAFGAAVALELLDNSIKSPDELTQFSGLNPLGSVGRLPGKTDSDRLITTINPFAAVSESYRLVRSNIQFAAADQLPRTLMLTSPGIGEGKSATVANLGIVMAQADFKTIIVDADLRRPALHKLFKLSNSQGLASLLSSSDSIEIEDVLQSTGIDNLKIIPSGPLPPNPSERLSSQRMVKLVEQLQTIADVIIFDTPPILAVTDAAVLANRLDGVILVVQARRTPRAAIKKAVQRLTQVRANLLGGILNQTPGKGGGYYDYAQSQLHRQSSAGQSTDKPLQHKAIS
jgi:succinoglycan biosynthesis transport protein ExoP